MEQIAGAAQGHRGVPLRIGCGTRTHRRRGRRIDCEEQAAKAAEQTAQAVTRAVDSG